MSKLALLASCLVLSVPVLAHAPARQGGDVVVTKEKHSDANPMTQQPAKDTTEVTWIGADRMRVEDGNEVTLLRADLKKLYRIDTKAKTYTAIDLPFDLKKYVPPEVLPMLEQMGGQGKATLTPTTETKQIKDWTATHFTLSSSMPMGGSMTQEMWVVKDLGIDVSSWRTMASDLAAMMPFSGAVAAEMKKIDGFPVLVETTVQMMGSESKSREAVVSLERKEPPAGHYDVPAGYTEKPFDLDGMMGAPGGGPGGRGRGHRPPGG